jgi:FKBP-type peptidyl-prolyl cis-trans isomerase
MTRRSWLVAGLAASLSLALLGCAGEPDKDLVTTKSGLQYKDLKEGEGPAAQDGDVVVVHYTGWLKTGKQFDSSVGKEPYLFQIGKSSVIKGWHEGVAGMKVGGKRRLIIPPDLGYGSQGKLPAIPGNATLIFDVELLKIEK